MGDWMSEGNMPAAASRKLSGQPGYEPTFLQLLEPVLPLLAQKKIKVAVNAGAADTQLLQQEVQKLVETAGLTLKTAWIAGDEVMEQVDKKLKLGDAVLENLYTGEQLRSWPYKPIYAQAYLGSFGVAKAFEEGADIVLCGRVADASLCMGAAVWWHGWTRDDLQELAAAFIAGHLVECSSYITGGNFSGFKKVPGMVNLGLPVAEIGAKGELSIRKTKGTGGILTIETCKSQLLYEIQGPWYFNSDVTAQIDQIQFTQIAPDTVRVSNIIGLPPPPTTKVGITAVAGYQAELHWAIVGLDPAEKSSLLERQIRLSIGEEHCSRFSMLKFTLNGSVPENPRSQAAATVDFRIFAQSKDQDDFSFEKFIRPCWDVIMCTYPGGTPHAAITSAIPRPWYEYWVTRLPQIDISHAAHLSWKDASIPIPPPTETRIYPSQQPSNDPTEPPPPFNMAHETVRGPLGSIVHARSGDKGPDANVGFYVRHEDEYEWLRHTLTIANFKYLLGDEYDESANKKIDRFELPNLWAVHFLCHGHLDRGVNSSSTYDILGKNLGEFLRARWVDLPKKFLERGTI